MVTAGAKDRIPRINYCLNFKIMGKINQGILGGFSGKVGNVVGGSWKGIG
jgi:hypothetical protein